jgi:hypothetical protein
MTELPTVLCVCLTADRHSFLDNAIRNFKAQTYKNRQLLVWDTGKEPYSDNMADGEMLVMEDNRILIVRKQKRNGDTIGSLRNEANGMFKSCEIIANFDDDDSYGPEYLDNQMHRLLESGKSVVGYHSAPFYRYDDGAWFQLIGSPQVALGATMVYRREYWERHPFMNRQVMEDRYFGDQAWIERQMVTEASANDFFASIHSGNTSPRVTSNSNWKPLPDMRDRYPFAFGKAVAA